MVKGGKDYIYNLENALGLLVLYDVCDLIMSEMCDPEIVTCV